MVEVGIGLITATLIPITQVAMVDCCFYLLILVVFMKLFMPMKEAIVVVMMEDVDLGLKIPATLPFTIVEKVLMVMGEADIGLRPSPLPAIIQVGLVYFRVYLLMIVR